MCLSTAGALCSVSPMPPKECPEGLSLWAWDMATMAQKTGSGRVLLALNVGETQAFLPRAMFALGDGPCGASSRAQEPCPAGVDPGWGVKLVAGAVLGYGHSKPHRDGWLRRFSSSPCLPSGLLAPDSGASDRTGSDIQEGRFAGPMRGALCPFTHGRPRAQVGYLPLDRALSARSLDAAVASYWPALRTPLPITSSLSHGGRNQRSGPLARSRWSMR